MDVMQVDPPQRVTVPRSGDVASVSGLVADLDIFECRITERRAGLADSPPLEHDARVLHDQTACDVQGVDHLTVRRRREVLMMDGQRDARRLPARVRRVRPRSSQR